MSIGSKARVSHHLQSSKGILNSIIHSRRRRQGGPWRDRACQSWKSTFRQSCRDVPSKRRGRSCGEPSTAWGKWRTLQRRRPRTGDHAARRRTWLFEVFRCREERRIEKGGVGQGRIQQAQRASLARPVIDMKVLKRTAVRLPGVGATMGPGRRGWRRARKKTPSTLPAPNTRPKPVPLCIPRPSCRHESRKSCLPTLERNEGGWRSGSLQEEKKSSARRRFFGKKLLLRASLPDRLNPRSFNVLRRQRHPRTYQRIPYKCLNERGRATTNKLPKVTDHPDPITFQSIKYNLFTLRFRRQLLHLLPFPHLCLPGSM